MCVTPSHVSVSHSPSGGRLAARFGIVCSRGGEDEPISSNLFISILAPARGGEENSNPATTFVVVIVPYVRQRKRAPL